jgi:hypothetical protein
MSSYSSTDIAYAAGIIDGEGYIGITEVAPSHSRKSPRIRGQVTVAMTDERIPAWLCENFGGTVHHYSPRRPGVKGTYQWVLANQNAADFCSIVEDSLKLKHLQARLVIDYYLDPRIKRVRSKGIPEDDLLARREYVTAIKLLNKRGTIKDDVYV